MSRANRRRQDRFGHRARSEGFPARSVYKLEEIDRRVRLLRSGLRVLDLGAAPGSWALYAASRIGEQGKLVAIDQHSIDIGLPPNAQVLQQDVMALDAQQLGGVGSFDLVLSDMAPRTSGQRHRDQFLSYELYMHALSLACGVLAEGGNFVGKLFQGAEFEQARAATAKAFAKQRIIKPDATRRESYELFMIGLQRRVDG